MAQYQVLEGTWEEIKCCEDELAGRFLRVVVETTETPRMDGDHMPTATPKILRGYGMFAHLPGGSEEFARMKQEEIALEERKFSR